MAISYRGKTVSPSVLVVDDEPMTRNLIRLMLEPAGFTVFEAEDGIAALEKIEQQIPAIVLLDVMMPNMDGITTCQQIRSNQATADLPVIMLSAKTHLNAVEEGLQAGANKYVSKPVARRELIDHINHLLGVSSSSSSPRV